MKKFNSFNELATSQGQHIAATSDMSMFTNAVPISVLLPDMNHTIEFTNHNMLERAKYVENVKAYYEDGSQVPRKFSYKDAKGQEQEYNGHDVNEDEAPYFFKMEEIEKQITDRNKKLLTEMEKLEREKTAKQSQPKTGLNKPEKIGHEIQDREITGKIKKTQEEWRKMWAEGKQKFKQQEGGLLALQKNKNDKKITKIVSDVPQLQMNIPNPSE